MDVTLQPQSLVYTIQYLNEVEMHPAQQRALAIAIGEESGVARLLWQPDFYAALGSVLRAQDVTDGNFMPTLLAGRLQKVKRNRRVRSFHVMRRWFRMQERNIEPVAPISKNSRKKHIPIPTDSTALVPLGGDITRDDIAFTTERADGVTVNWYSMRDLEPGAIIFRIDNGLVYESVPSNRHVTLYQKLDTNQWARAELDGSMDIVNLPTTLADMAGRGNRFTQVARVPGRDVPLLRPPQTDTPQQAGTVALCA